MNGGMKIWDGGLVRSSSSFSNLPESSVY